VDKKNAILGTVLMIAAILVFAYGERYGPKRPLPAQIQAAVKKDEAAAPASPSNAAAAAAEPAAQQPAPSSPAGAEPMFSTVEAVAANTKITSLSNSFVSVNFTDEGGAIRDVALHKYPAALYSPDPFIFNELHASPILAFLNLPGLGRDARYQMVSKTDTEVVYRAVVGQLEVIRKYDVSPDKVGTTDPYVVRCETTILNNSGAPTKPMRLALSVGTAAPNNALDTGVQLMSEYSNGKSQVKVLRSSLESSGGILGFGAHEAKAVVDGTGPVEWASVKNQFFASILTPDDPAAAVETRRIKLLNELPDSNGRAYGIDGAVDFDVPALQPHSQHTISGNLYVGPKEYPRLANADVFKRDEDRVMDFGFSIFRFCAAILIYTMSYINRGVHNWGVAIILTTLILKVIFIPVTIAQSRMAKRNQRAAPELTAAKEKYKDNPQKLQAATMEVYKKHKINPVAGCLPMLLTLPFFWAFFTLLRSAAELRFSSFLWSHDLSAPDTVATIALPILGAVGINILPILLGVVNFAQSHVMPQPTVDNAQMKMMKFMPVFMTLFYYSYACALSVYSITNGLFTIGQQLVINRRPDLEDTAPVGPGPGKKVKNVTPRKG
jgi:YidC/Oxa1 family membrane protein insertase